MVASRALPKLKNEDGQSVLEFMFMLPVMIAFVLILVRVNTAIQMSIVNQQYVRAQAHWLTFNSSVYPTIDLRQKNFDNLDSSRMIIGMSEKSITDENNEPIASTQLVAQSKTKAGGEGPSQEEPRERGMVRVRTTVSLCTQSNHATVNGVKRPITPNSLSENTQINFCESPQDG